MLSPASWLVKSYRFERVTWKAQRTTRRAYQASVKQLQEGSLTDDQPGFFVERNLRFDFEKGCNAHQRSEALLKTLK